MEQTNSPLSILPFYQTTAEQLHRKYPAAGIRKKPTVTVTRGTLPAWQQHFDELIDPNQNQWYLHNAEDDTQLSILPNTDLGVYQVTVPSDRTYVVFNNKSAYRNCGLFYLRTELKSNVRYSDVFRVIELDDTTNWYSITYQNGSAISNDFIFRNSLTNTFYFKGYMTTEAPVQESEDILNGRDRKFRSFDSIKSYQVMRVMDVAPHMVHIFKAMEVNKFSSVVLTDQTSGQTYDLDQIEVAVESQPQSNPFSIVNLRWLDRHSIYRGHDENQSLSVLQSA